jgi:hypothetical protein
MQHRTTDHRERSKARVSVRAGLSALVVSTLMVLSLPIDARASAPDGGQGGGRSCKNEIAAERPSSSCPVTPPGGAMGSAIDTTNLAEQLLSSVAKSAGSKIGGQLAGWALESIFGPSPDPTQELKDQLDVLQGQMTDLQTQLHQLDTDLRDALKRLATEGQQSTFDVAAAQVNTDAASLADYQIQLDSWLKKKPGTPVDGSQSAELQTMRSTLGVIIQHLDKAMVGAPGSRGLIAIYRDVIASKTPYPVGRFYTSAFTTPMSDMLDYYQSLAVQAFNLMAEVNHLSWTVGTTTFLANDAVVETYAGLVPTMLTHWSELATGGVGRLPDHVVADTQTGLMWSQSNLTLAGQKVFCWAACGANLSLSTLLTPNTVIDGVSGWSIPSQAQFTTLASGQGQGTFKFLTSNGFQWQRDGLTAMVNNIPITAPAYWSSGGTSVSFAIDFSLHLYDQNHWPFFLPGPGAVAVRPIG